MTSYETLKATQKTLNELAVGLGEILENNDLPIAEQSKLAVTLLESHGY